MVRPEHRTCAATFFASQVQSVGTESPFDYGNKGEEVADLAFTAQLWSIVYVRGTSTARIQPCRLPMRLLLGSGTLTSTGRRLLSKRTNDPVHMWSRLAVLRRKGTRNDHREQQSALPARPSAKLGPYVEPGTP